MGRLDCRLAERPRKRSSEVGARSRFERDRSSKIEPRCAVRPMPPSPVVARRRDCVVYGRLDTKWDLSTESVIRQIL